MKPYYQDTAVTIYNNNCLDILKQLDSGTIDCTITSPPYWALRDYGHEDQLGLEPTFQEYINKLCDIFDEVKRVLKKSGTCWVVIGDSYLGGKAASGGTQRLGPNQDLDNQRNDVQVNKTGTEKCLAQVPFRFAIEMVNRGWILRNTIIWHKPNCMPASADDRFTVDFEYVFFFVKNKKYYFEQQLEPAQDWGYRDRSNMRGGTKDPKLKHRGFKDCNFKESGRNKRAVWTIKTKPYKEAHFAVFPKELIDIPIKAGCPKGGIVLDPFMGSGTTARLAKDLGRKCVGIEISKEYCDIAVKRLGQEVLF